MANIHLWDDLRFPARSLGAGPTAPDSDTTYGWLLFDGSTRSEEAFAQLQLPHTWAEGTAIRPHVHWCKTTAASGTVFWQFDYRWFPIGEVMEGSWTTLSSYTPVADTPDDNTAYRHLITSFGEVDATGKQISDMLIMKLTRVYNNGNDTYTADAALLELDVHIQNNALGSEGLYFRTGNRIAHQAIRR